jgi:hypothetical protein
MQAVHHLQALPPTSEFRGRSPLANATTRHRLWKDPKLFHRREVRQQGLTLWRADKSHLNVGDNEPSVISEASSGQAPKLKPAASHLLPIKAG